jgi:Mn2+/Fe2+ NRAMP family transporter
MHWGLRIAVAIAAVVFLAHAAFTPFYETGYARVISPILGVGLAALFGAFLLRKRWAWGWVLAYSGVAVVLNLAFLPEHEHFGEYLWLARVLVAVEVVACAIVVAFMLHPATKRAFYESAS